METPLDTFELSRNPYPTDVSDEEWAFVAPYLTLMDENAPQRDYRLRESFNALRWLVRAGAAWRLLPTNFPPWHSVYGQTQRWIKAGVFEDIVDDLRALVREALGKKAQPTAVIIDSQTLRSTPESGDRAGYDGGKKTKGSKVHHPRARGYPPLTLSEICCHLLLHQQMCRSETWSVPCWKILRL